MSEAKEYKLGWTFVPRIATQHFGSGKYTTSLPAIGELVSNSFDAGALTVKINLVENELGRFDSIEISDDGHGISPFDLRSRFMAVGVESDVKRSSAERFGRLGIGRLAVFRIGTVSEWESVSRNDNEFPIKLCFKLSDNEQGDILISETTESKLLATGTNVKIYNLRDSGKESLSPQRISADLLSQFCSYLIGNPTKRIFVQNELIDVSQLINEQFREEIPPSANVPTTATLIHMLLDGNVERSRMAGQLLFASKGRTVAAEQPTDPPTPRYLGLIECAYLDSIVTSNREALINMDDGFLELKDEALKRVEVFGDRLKSERDRRFIERARQEEFYPYKTTPSDTVNQVQQAVFDVVLEKVHENINLESMSNKQKKVIFRLLQRSLVNENLMDILGEVANLSDVDIEKFRNVLEQTTLNSIIKLSSEVTERLAFLNVLHDLVYGEISKFVKERSQLHKILEPNCWIFGPRFYLGTSDKSFRSIISKHREAVGLSELSKTEINSISGIQDIPDLFLAATREYPIIPRVHNVLVELKSPSTNLGRKEVEQVRRYAETISESDQFEKKSTRWDIYLVSGTASDEIERDRNQKDRPFGMLYEWENMSVWAFQWSELIAQAREEMKLVREHLQEKSNELRVSDYLRSKFPSILDNLEKAAAPK